MTPVRTFVVLLAVTTALLTGCAAPPPEPESDRPDPETVAAGRQLFGQYGCEGCHAIAAGEPSLGPNLTRVAQRYDRDVIRLWMMDSDAVYARYGRRPVGTDNSIMPNLGVARQDADAILAFLVGGL